MDEVTISLNIADRPYKMVIKKEEEQVIRKAAALINDKVVTYSKSYAFKDKQDLLAMIVLQFASNSIKKETEIDQKTGEVYDRLMEIDAVLSTELDEKKE
ncbi:MAG: cell division protein ZapA [Bacteroidales bacterium]